MLTVYPCKFFLGLALAPVPSVACVWWVWAVGLALALLHWLGRWGVAFYVFSLEGERGREGEKVTKIWYQYFIFTIFVVLKKWYYMSREILYKKTSFVEDKSKEFLERIKKQNEANFEKTHNAVMGKSKNEGILAHISNCDSKNLIEWLKSHPLINISALCREAGINRSNFDKSLKMGLISPKHELKLINILKKYGYV